MRRLILLLLAGGLLAAVFARGPQPGPSNPDADQMSELDRRLDAVVRGR